MEGNGGGNNSPVIIKKKGKGHEGHHGGAWKVAYADFVTAMMALFIVLWILSQSEEVKKNVAGYFRDPTGFAILPGNGAGSAIPNDQKIPSIDQNLIMKMERKAAESKQLTEMGDQIKSELAGAPEFKSLMDQIEFQIVDEGLRMEIMESANQVFFEIGTASLNPKAAQLLKTVGSELTNLNNLIVIEGHTDSRPFPGSGYTNFDLSADRANTARQALIDGGLPEKMIDEVRGYADRRLRNKENPYDVVNRRISIIVKFSEQTNNE